MSKDEKPKKTRVDQELESEMGYFKEPIVRLQQVEDSAAQAINSGDLERALFLRMQVLALAKLCYEDPSLADRDLILAKAHLQLSTTYSDMGLGDQAFFHAQKAMDRVDPRKTGGDSENNDMTVSCLLAVGRAMVQRGDSKCVNYLQRALVVNHDLHGPDHVSNYQIHEGFGDFYIQLGDSRALMMEAEEHRKHKHKRPVDPTNNMDCLSAGDDKKPDYYGKAMDELGRAWELIAPGKRHKLGKSSAPRDPRMAPLYSKMAKTQSKIGNEEEASQLYQRSIECHQAASHPNDASVAQLQYELGVTHHKNKKYSESMEALDIAAKYCEKKEANTGLADPLLLLVKKQQAITLYDGNEVQSAKSMFEELMSLQRKEYGGSSVIVAETLKYLGDVHVALKNRGTARKYYSRAVRILRRRLGPTDETVRQLESYILQLNLDDGKNKSPKK